MKIYIEQILDTGLELAEKCEPSALDLDREDIRFTEPINLLAQITKNINNISVELKIDARMHLICSRCLERFSLPLSKQVKLNIATENKEFIDITDNLREEIILSYPLKLLCRADCLGLCPNCGQNLNKGRCNCKAKPSEPFSS